MALSKYATCMAPADDNSGVVTDFGRSCGKPATAERSIVGVMLPFCQRHSKMYDEEEAEGEAAAKAPAANA